MMSVKMTNEIQRLQERNMPVPVMEVRHIPYENIVVTSGKHQVRRMNIDEDKTLTYQIENMGLLNPIVLMPYGNTGKYVPVSGHTRFKSCKSIRDNQLTVAERWGYDAGVPAYVYEEEITDLKTFVAVAEVLNDHQQATPVRRADLVDNIIALYNNGEFVKDGAFDYVEGRNFLYSMRLTNFSNRELGGIIDTVVNTLNKNSRLENFEEGSIRTYDNKKHLNARLFSKFGISDNMQHDHYVETEDGVVANSIRGIGPSNSLWVTEQLSSFADYQMDLEDHGITPDERVLYWHVTDIVDCGDDLTALECLTKTRMKLLNTARKKARAFMPEYRPTKIAFIPQFQVSVDADGNEVFGEEVTYYEM